MGAVEGNKNAAGPHQVASLNNRKLAAEVRTMALNKILVILSRPSVEMNEHDKDLHDQLLLRLAPTVLPRITEVTGEDGGPIKVDNEEQSAVNAQLLAYLHNGKLPPQHRGKVGDKGPASDIAPAAVSGK